MLTIPTAPTLQTYPGVIASGQQITVGVNKQFSTIDDAIAAAQSGDTILIDAGTYLSGEINVQTDVRLIGVGGMVHLKANTGIGKGLLTTDAGVSLYVENFEFSGAANGDKNGAGIRHQGLDLTIVNSYFHDNQDGILSTGDQAGNVYISNSEFGNNGHGGGLAHGIYINSADNLVVTDSHFYGTTSGHHIKTMTASNTWVINTILDDTGGTSSYAIDVSLGGNLYVADSTITQTASSENAFIVNFDAGRGGVAGEVIFDNNTITNSHDNGKFIRNTTDAIVQLYNNDFINSSNGNLDITAISDRIGNTFNGSPMPDMDVMFGANFGTSGNDTMVGGTPTNDKIAGLGGNDVIYGGDLNGFTGVDTIFGGDGNDSIFGGDGADYIAGGNGNDYIDGGRHEDVLSGNDGDDTIVALIRSTNSINGGDGNDVIYGGAWGDNINGGNGFDIAVYENNFSSYNLKNSKFGAITLDSPQGNSDDGRDNLVTIEAIQFKDGVYWTQFQIFEPGVVLLNIAALMSGEPIGRRYDGTDGDDVLSGSDGGDTIIGYKGNDHISGQAGVDIIYGGVGSDTLIGDTELDVLYGGTGDDLLLGGSGNDYIEGNEGNDSIVGGTFSDTLKGGDGGDSIEGNAGHDILEGHDGDDLLIGGIGSDTIVGYTGSDTLLGGAFDDVLVGLGQSDSIDGDGGDDLIFLGFGADTATGGNGNDTIGGLNGSDHMSGNAGNDVMRGEQGNDTLIGGADNDILDGGDDSDLYLWGGGDGRDLFVDSGATGSDIVRTSSTSFKGLGSSLNGIEKIEHESGATFDVIGGNGNDNWDFTSVDLTTVRSIQSGNGNDTVDGTTGDDNISGGLGADLLIGRSGNDTISGGAGGDLLISMSNHDSVDGGGGDDEIFLGFGTDTASGGIGNDTIQGLNGADHIAGDEGNDVIHGEQGSDTLIGGDGNDLLLGGTESDTFSFDSADGADTIEDFQNGIDLIEITGGMSFSDVTLAQVGNDLDVTFGTTTVRLLGVDQSDINSGDFLFS